MVSSQPLKGAWNYEFELSIKRFKAASKSTRIFSISWYLTAMSLALCQFVLAVQAARLVS